MLLLCRGTGERRGEVMLGLTSCSVGAIRDSSVSASWVTVCEVNRVPSVGGHGRKLGLMRRIAIIVAP